MTIITYLRRSREDPAGDTYGLDAQRRVIAAYLELQAQLSPASDEASAEVIEDGVSGGVPVAERPRLGPVLDRMEPGDRLVVARLDRLTRSVRDFVNLLPMLEERGIALICLDPHFDLTTATGRLVAQIFAVFAEFQRVQTSELMQAARAAKRADGKYVGGTPALFTTVQEDGTVLRDELSIRRVKHAYLFQHRTLRDIAAEYGVSPGAVRMLLRREGVHLRGRVPARGRKEEA